MSADAYVSAYVLLQLGNALAFQNAIRFDEAVGWFATHESTLEPEAKKIWDRARSRCRVARASAPVAQLWS